MTHDISQRWLAVAVAAALAAGLQQAAVAEIPKPADAPRPL